MFNSKIFKKGIQLVLGLSLVFSMFLGFQTQAQATEDPSILRIGWGVEPDSLSPFIAYSQPSAELFQLVYDPLIAFDNDLQPVGRLAKSWEISDDNLTWTFELEEGVKWHDGEPFTSADVKFTYELMQSSGLGLYSGYMDGITSIDTPDDETVIIHTEKPKANMLQITAPILPKHIWGKLGETEIETWANEEPIGTGAFKFSEFKQGEYLKITANKDYFMGSPKIDQVVYVLYANNDTMAQSVKTGELDVALNFNTSQVELLKKEKNLEVISNPALGFTELAINSWPDEKSKGNPLLLDKRIKQAMEYAIDKQKIIDIAYSGQGTPGTTLIPPSVAYWHYEPTKDELRSFDPGKAKSVLENAGYKDTDEDGIREDAEGNKLEFRFYLRSKNAEEVRAGQMIAKYLEEIGIKANIENVDDGLLIDKIYGDADFDMFIWGWGTDQDPTTILRVMSTNQIGNLSDSNYSNPTFDELLAEQATIIDSEERQEMVYEMQRILYEDAPYIILTYDNTIQAINTEKWTGWNQAAGYYFFAANTYNYLNVEPKAPETPTTENTSTSDTEKVADSKETSSDSGIAAYWWILIIAAIIILFLVMKRKGKKNVNFHDDI